MGHAEMKTPSLDSTTCNATIATELPMQIYCKKCQCPQAKNEENCKNCGAKFGGELWILATAGAMILGALYLMFFSEQTSARAQKQIFFYFILPVLIGSVFLYDHNSSRRAIYFWGGAGAIGIALWLINA
jgi:hypothetical protein